MRYSKIVNLRPMLYTACVSRVMDALDELIPDSSTEAEFELELYEMEYLLAPGLIRKGINLLCDIGKYRLVS